MIHRKKLSENIVIPLFEIVVFPDSRTKFQVDRATGELLLAAMEPSDTRYAVGLTVKSGVRPLELTGIAVQDRQPVPDLACAAYG